MIVPLMCEYVHSPGMYVHPSNDQVYLQVTYNIPATLGLIKLTFSSRNDSAKEQPPELTRRAPANVTGVGSSAW